MLTIVIGLDVHKQSVTAVATHEAGRPLGAKTAMVGSDELVGWASALSSDERLWAVEDCRQLTRWLERQLLYLGEEAGAGAAEAGASRSGESGRRRAAAVTQSDSRPSPTRRQRNTGREAARSSYQRDDEDGRART